MTKLRIMFKRVYNCFTVLLIITMNYRYYVVERQCVSNWHSCFVYFMTTTQYNVILVAYSVFLSKKESERK